MCCEVMVTLMGALYYIIRVKLKLAFHLTGIHCTPRIHGTTPNTWYHPEYMVPPQIHGTTPNIWYHPEYTVPHQIHDTPPNTWYHPKYMVPPQIHGTTPNIWYPPEYTVPLLIYGTPRIHSGYQCGPTLGGSVSGTDLRRTLVPE